MRTLLLLNNLLLIFILLLGSGMTTVSAKPLAEPVLAEAAPEDRELIVTLRSATGATITFKSDSGSKVTAPRDEAESDQIPHLILNRNGVPTPGFERTLIVSLENIEVPPGGAYARLTIETQHGDPDLGGGPANRIQVMKETRFIPYFGETEHLRSIDFRIVFQRTFEYRQKQIRTPTDYFNYHVRLFDTQGNTLKIFTAKYAFLMENQWRVPLPNVLEAAPGAAPQHLVIYYYDMIPFQMDSRDLETQIARIEVERFIQTKLMPDMVKAFEMQTNLWDLPWYEEWSNYRTDEDPKSLSVALAERGTWFHGNSPSLGHAMISIRVDGSFAEYTNLKDGIMTVFHHELFHNQQRNISLHFGSKGIISGKDQAWEVFSEGTSVLATVVAQPEVEFEPSTRDRSYLKRANAFIGADGIFSGDLNKSYKYVPYHMAIYWRFLYENCGGINNGVEDPAAGMKIIRNILEILYAGEIVDVRQSTDVAGAFPRILDAALLATPSCKFHSYEESLTQFARAIYLLRMENGRCPASGIYSPCSFFDPDRLYTSPHAEQYAAGEGRMLINGSIPSSFGVDPLELELNPWVDGKSLRLILKSSSTPQDKFHIELFGIQIGQTDSGTGRSLTRAGILKSAQTQNGQLILDLPELDIESYNALGVLVTRLDPYEKTGSPGNYLIQFEIE